MQSQQPLIQTGIRGLDEILLGGITPGNVVLVEGTPGTGKTSLGLEFIYRGAMQWDEPGLIVSFEIEPRKLLRDAAGFGWDFQTLRDRGKVHIIYTSPLVLLQELQSHDSVLLQEIARNQARRVLIDGLTPLRLFGETLGGRPYRDSLHLLIESLQTREVTALLTRELPSCPGSGNDFGHEEFLCDTVLNLQHEADGRSAVRSLEIRKSRGQPFIAGRHTLRIESGRGVRVYRRAQSRSAELLEQPTSTVRSSMGVTALDAMLGGGVYAGSVTLVVGISGTGKTVLGVQFLVEGARRGQRGLLVTLDEHPAQIVRNAEGLELGLQAQVDAGRLLIHYEIPYELELDVHFHEITRLIEEHRIERVLIDSIAAYQVDRRADFHNFVYALTTYLKNRLVTTVYNFESPELLGVSQISLELKASTIVDNIVLLNYVEIGNRLRRAITVPKARGSAPVRDTREYVIRAGGIHLVNNDQADGEAVPQLPFSYYYGVLARSPSRRSPVIDEQVFSGQEPPESTPPLDEGEGQAAPVRNEPLQEDSK